MGRLGDFLEAVYGPTDRFRTIRAVIHQQIDLDAAGRATGGGRRAAGRRIMDVRPAGASARAGEADIRVWISGPDRVRVEQIRKRDGREEFTLVVVNGDRWWRRDHHGRVEAGGPGPNARRSGPGLADIERHFSPASLRRFFVALALESLGPVRTAGRDCLRVRAVPRPSGGLWPHWLPAGADEYELHADPDHGVVLFVAGRFGGAVFESDEVTEVAFDEPLDPGLFAYQPQPGEPVRPPDPVVERLTLAAAVARMPFTVLVPARPPDPDRPDFEVLYHPPREDGSRPYLSLLYMGDARLSVHQSQTPATLEGLEWEAVERGGRRVAISDPGPGAGTRVVRLEHLGTHVDIWSDLDRDQLLDLVASLIPASPASGD